MSLTVPLTETPQKSGVPPLLFSGIHKPFQLFSLYYNFLLWLWLLSLKHPNHKLQKKITNHNYHCGDRRYLPEVSIAGCCRLNHRALSSKTDDEVELPKSYRKKRKTGDGQSIFLKYQHWSLVDGDVCHKEVRAAAAVSQSAPTG